MPTSNFRPKSLLLSIHDVGPSFESEIGRLREFLADRFDNRRLALLVVPNRWGEAPLRPGSPFATLLRGWAEQGNEIFVHGWFHRDHVEHARLVARLKARFLTAGEGEFLGLGRSAAVRLMRAGMALLEDITGRPTSGFVAPAWLYGRGAREALAEAGFPLAEDHFEIWHPPSGRVLSRGPVISWASRSHSRTLSSVAFARTSRLLLRDRPQVRIALHPGDLSKACLRDSIGTTLAYYLQTHRPGRYIDLLADPPGVAS